MAAGRAHRTGRAHPRPGQAGQRRRASVQLRPGRLNQLPAYEHTIREYGKVAERQLVCAFQVHVAPGEADRALAVYNAARSYLPLLAALSANAPFYEGRDTGLASIRPKLCDLLPRQGVPPAIESWDELASALRWGATAGSFPPGAWWWELRPHWRFGTLEFRVPDGQSSPANAGAVTAVIQSLVVWLGPAPRGRGDSEGRPVVGHRGEPLVGLPARGRGGDGQIWAPEPGCPRVRGCTSCSTCSSPWPVNLTPPP